LLAHGRWFFSGTPASSTTKTGRQSHDIAEILLKVALTPKIKSIKSGGDNLVLWAQTIQKITFLS
jgi:hypothetical protein